MTTSSAPAKVYLFGEHAVVYGEPAVACAVDLRAEVEVEEAEEGSIVVESDDVEVRGVRGSIDSSGERWLEGAGSGEGLPGLEYVAEAAEALDAEGVSIRVMSDIPVGSGLGSSAAVTVATVDALSRHIGLGLEPEEVAELAYGIEERVQGAASPTDTYVSATGGVNLVEPGEEVFETLDGPAVEFVAGDTGSQGSTAELVAGVRELKESHPSVDEVVSTVGGVSREGAELYAEEDLEGVGELMDVNHGLLEALGVSTPALASLVHASREAGALGSKITGAGGGGCVVSLVEDGSGDRVSAAVEGVGGEAIPLETDSDGVRPA